MKKINFIKKEKLDNQTRIKILLLLKLITLKNQKIDQHILKKKSNTTIFNTIK